MSDNNQKPNKHPILSRYKMTHTGIDTKDVLSGKGDFTTTYKLALIVGVGLFLATILYMIFRLIISPTSPVTLLSIIMAVGYLTIFFIVGIITQEHDGSYSRTVVGVALTLFTPVMWFYSGGFDGAGPVWFLFTAIFLCAGLNIKQYIKVGPIFILVLIGTICTTIKYPQLVQHESEAITKINTIGSICISIIFFSMIILLQRHISEMDRLKVVELQKELSENNEELTASNEELIAINTELTEVSEKLMTAMDNQKMFSASMTHELRSPLNGIEGSLQMMLMSDTLNEDHRVSVENALKACRNLSRTVNDMLDYSKLSEGKFEIVDKEFDLRDVISDVRYLFEETTKAKDLDFIINANPNMNCSLIGDDVRITQILTNLISNSVKYTQTGSVTCNFDVKDNSIFFTIEDTGIGMSKESLAVLFDPFTRFDLKKNSGIQGTGLGMNIVYNLIKAMKGDIKVSSEIDKGTRFDVTIPVAINDKSIVYSSEHIVKKENDFVLKDFSNINILCVDDTKINLIVFKGLLKNTNANVDTAIDYFTALEAAKAKKYDLIFLDHFMPDKDGIEVYRDIRNGDSVNKNTPVIMLTGNTSDDYTDLYRKEGFDAWLAKPIVQKDLVDAISKMV